MTMENETKPTPPKSAPASCSSEELDSFERAFHRGDNTCRMTCNCGKEYFDAYNSGYTWEEGEHEDLEARAAKGDRVVACDGAVGVMQFEGREYADWCTCWHPRAAQIVRFIYSHAHGIARFLSLERDRKQREAARMPLIPMNIAISQPSSDIHG